MSEKPPKVAKRSADPIDFDDPEEAWRHLDANLKKYMPPEDIAVVQRAYEFGAVAHRNQTRQTGAPYITHPLTVANILTGLRIDRASIVAAILHDVVEDTEVTLAEVKESFGEEVSELVDGLTKISKIRFSSTQERLAENFRKMIVAMAKDLRVILIKLSDRLHNMRTLDHLPTTKRQRVALETVEIYAPLAGRLGIYGIKSELEDLCLRQLKPEVYAEIKKNVAKKREARQSYIDEVIDILKENLAKYGLTDFEVYGRPKHFFSIYKKMSEKQMDFEDIFDLFAFRIIVNSVKECYEALGVVHSVWRPMPGRFKDYIAMPKPNLYQSLHTTVVRPEGDPAEIQIRTRGMHEVSELGIAAHWAYKQKGHAQYNKADLQKFSWLRQMMQWQTELQDPNEFLEAVKVDLFDEEIFVFTPRGDVIALPMKASCLDFAFNVHTDLGSKTIGAKINGRMVPIKTLLKSGNIVEIITSKNQKPSKDWMNYVYTSKAKNKIRAFLRIEQRERGREMGKQLLSQQLSLIGKSFDSIENTPKEKDHLVSTAREGNFEDFLVEIGYGKIDIDGLLRRAYPTSFKPIDDKKIVSTTQAKFKGKSKKIQSGVSVSGIDNILVHYARCCNPLPGEEMVGFITRGRGVTVHRGNCARSLDLDPQRKVPVNWRSVESTELGHAAIIRVMVQDKPGILGEISTAISMAGANINRAQIEVGSDMTGRLDFEIMVHGLGQLQTVIGKVEMMPFVISVQRINEYKNSK